MFHDSATARLSKNLSKLMKQRGLSREDVMRMASISVRTFYRIKNNDNVTVHLSTVESLAKAFKVDVTTMLKD